jgi:hypothetical protein
MKKTINLKVMKTLLSFLLMTTLWLTTVKASSANEWPKVIKTSQAKITVYQPQPLSLKENKMECMAAVSILENKSSNPVFGSIWADAMMGTNRDRRSVTLESLTITNARFPGITDAATVSRYKSMIEADAPKWNLVMSLDELLATLDMSKKEQSLSEELAVDPPTIIFKAEYSVLVVIDGEPIWERDSESGFDRVVNTPFTILRNENKQLYLYGGGFWYNSIVVEGPWNPITALPKNLQSIDKSIKQSEKENNIEKSAVPAKIVVSFEPTELIQSDGRAEFTPLEGTGLLFMTNSEDEIFMHTDSQKYFVLISGRWYRSGALSGPWQYVAADQLPEDFANINSDSPMGSVLANVAGTEEAREAVIDAQIPQTAKVDRNNATASVEYDGDPKFVQVEGTSLNYAVNTSSPVIKAEGLYYVVENGVWFISKRPDGPWEVATMRPQAVAKIPPSCPVYNIKYVYIYDVTPEYVYMGYTPGYLGTYIYGPVVVYGTGYHYRPWYGRYYYPRPGTWGFNMHYNPWTGWSLGIHYSYGWLHYDVWRSHAWHAGYGGGWWGPTVYRPPYHVHHHQYYSNKHSYYSDKYNENYYGKSKNVNKINSNYTNNIYNHRKDVVTNDVARKPAINAPRQSARMSSNAVTYPSTRQSTVTGSKQGTSGAVSRGTSQSGTSTQSQSRTITRQSTSGVPTNSPGTSSKTSTRQTGNNGSVNTESSKPATHRSTKSVNNVAVDREGNVYKRSKEGNVQQYNGRDWSDVPVNIKTEQRVNRQIDQRERGSVNTAEKSHSTARGGNVGEGYTKKSSGTTRKETKPAEQSTSKPSSRSKPESNSSETGSPSSGRRTH